MAFRDLFKRTLPEESGRAKAAAETDAQNPNVKKKNYNVTGISHYKSALDGMALENRAYAMNKRELIKSNLVERRIFQYNFNPQSVELVPEPTNEFDSNAIMVRVDGSCIGYIKAGNCAHLLKVIKENRIGGISIDIHGGKYKFVSLEQDDDCNEVYVMETGTANYSAKVEVIENA